MVSYPIALIAGGIIGFFIAMRVSVWERKMVKEEKSGIVTLSILGGIACAVIAFLAIGEIAPYNKVSDILRNIIFATLCIFVPFRKINIWKNILAPDNSNTNTIDDENKEDGESQEVWACNECGAVVDASAIKCPNCGADFKD